MILTLAALLFIKKCGIITSGDDFENCKLTDKGYGHIDLCLNYIFHYIFNN